MKAGRISVVMTVLVAAQSGAAQSLYERPIAAPPLRGGQGNPGGGASAPAPVAKPRTEGEQPQPMQTPAELPGSAPAASGPVMGPAGPVRYRRGAGAPSLEAISLYAIEAPAAKEFAEHDLVTIIISERSKTERNQKLDAKKEYDLDAKMTAWVRLLELLEARAVPDGKVGAELPAVGAQFSTDFKGDGKYNREDKLTDRIQARVVEVKPNGTLLVEARRTITTDKEGQEVVLSGMCRTEDVTEANTIQSNQLYDLTLNVQNKGDVKDASKKGLIPQVLDTLFNF